MPALATPSRLSIELTNRCSKSCWFCYNHSSPSGSLAWDPPALIDFLTDCSTHTIRAVSFGGGEPLQYEPLFDLLAALRGRLFRSLTTNGLPLTSAATFTSLVAAAPDKVHVSIHFPSNDSEVRRVIRAVADLTSAGLRAGVNLLVARTDLPAARRAAQSLHTAGIANDRIVYLPMRGQDTPTPAELAAVAGNKPFQSMTCLPACAASPRFASIAADQTVAWCSYTTARRKLAAPTYAALVDALTDLPLTFCGGTANPTSTVLPLPVLRERAGVRVLTAQPAASASRTSPSPESEIRKLHSATNEGAGWKPAPQVDAAAFPAAHSMDTSWFAADADGRLGFFHSGEPGPVPTAVKSEDHGYDVIDGIFLRVPAAFIGAVGQHVSSALTNDAMALTSTHLLEGARVRIGTPVTTPGGLLYPVMGGLIPGELFRQLHDAGICAGCIGDEEFEGRHYALLGVYPFTGNYLTDAERALAGGGSDHPPYRRVAAPKFPLLLDQLPPDLRSAAAQVRFPTVRFGETTCLQPLEHLPCRTWGRGEHDTYLASDMRTHVPLPPPPDFPAAHSMDTSWFAADADGRLAFFHTGEPGAVPVAAAEEIGHDLFSGNGFDVFHGIFLRVPAAFLNAFGSHVRDPFSSDGMFLTSTDLLDRRDNPHLKIGGPVATPGGPLYPVTGFITADEFRLVHERGVCAGCIGDEDGRGKNFALFGLYAYDCDDLTEAEEALAGGRTIHPPYHRIAAPKFPLLLEQLPPDLQAAAARVRFPSLRFADAERLQPLEHFPCRTWGRADTYLAADMKTHVPLPPEPEGSAPPEDFPAAHSMDTDWFAADGDGHIGLFSSGETGPVPSAFRGDDEPTLTLIRRMFLEAPDAVAARGVIGAHAVASDSPAWDDLGRTRPEVPASAWRALVQWIVHGPPRPDVLLRGVGMFLSSTDSLPQAGGEGVCAADSVETAAGRLNPVWFDALPGDGYRLLHEASRCAGCLDRRGAPWRLGFFVYGPGDGLGESDPRLYDLENLPYYQLAAPLRPLPVADLPPGVREYAGVVRFPSVRFPHAPYVQPIEHVPCTLWPNASDPTLSYLASDLKTQRPVPRAPAAAPPPQNR